MQSTHPTEAITSGLPLIDTHTHFDIATFDADRVKESALAYQNGVKHLVLIGFLSKYFEQMVACHAQMNQLISSHQPCPIPHLAFGLHPFYISDHCDADLQVLEKYIQTSVTVAIGEIGLDTFTATMKRADNYAKQQDYFIQQLDLAKAYHLPALLHIRKAHGDTLKILKAEKFKNGGIAHSFSGGIQEAKAFVNLGFKIGITGQVTNPNAKKLRITIVELVKAVGLESLVIETDCPDFTPLVCHHTHGRRNVPANLVYVFDELASLLQVEKTELATQLWQNSASVLNLKHYASR